jgi:hypothetical protein
MSKHKRNTRRVSMELESGSPRKQAGSNYFTLTVPSDDWRIPDQTVNMTVRDAQTVQRFLNKSLAESE